MRWRDLSLFKQTFAVADTQPMTPPAITDNNSTPHTKRWTAERFFVAFTKVVTSRVLIVVVLGVVLLDLSLRPNWGPAFGVGVEPLNPAATTITVYASGCEEVRFNVQERNDEIRVSAEHKSPNAPVCDIIETEVIQLDEAVGSRQIVNANTDQAIEPYPCLIAGFHPCAEPLEP